MITLKVCGCSCQNSNSVVTDTQVHELCFLGSQQHIQYYLPDLKMQLSSFCPPRLRHSLSSSSSSLPLPSPCMRSLSDLPVNSCGYSELCLRYWKHPSNTPISLDVKMIGCALFGYPFQIAGHDWRELPEMMGLLCDAAKRGREKKKRQEEEGNRRKDRKKGLQSENTDTA